MDMPRTYRDTDRDTGVTDMDTYTDFKKNVTRTRTWTRTFSKIVTRTWTWTRQFPKNRDTDVDMDTS